MQYFYFRRDFSAFIFVNLSTKCEVIDAGSMLTLSVAVSEVCSATADVSLGNKCGR